MSADEKLKTANIAKAATIHARFELMLEHDICISAADILNKCRNTAELNYWYRIVCLDDYDERVVI